MTKQDWFKTV